jgi:hypothetical protein
VRRVLPVNHSGALYVLALLLPCTSLAQDSPLAVASPSGRIEVRLLEAVPVAGALPRVGYEIYYDGDLLVAPSPLGIRIFSQDPVLGEGARLTASKTSSVDERFLVPALDGPGRNHYNGLVAEFKEDRGLERSFAIEVRVFDDGMGLRYILQRLGAGDRFIIEEDETEFRLAADDAAGTLSATPSSTEIATPFTLDLAGLGRVTLAEVPHTRDWWPTRTYFRPRGNGTTLIARLPSPCGPCVDGPAVDPRFKLEIRTPAKSSWRVLMIGPKQGFKTFETILSSLNRAESVER